LGHVSAVQLYLNSVGGVGKNDTSDDESFGDKGESEFVAGKVDGLQLRVALRIEKARLVRGQNRRECKDRRKLQCEGVSGLYVDGSGGGIWRKSWKRKFKVTLIVGESGESVVGRRDQSVGNRFAGKAVEYDAPDREL
jgi:hypothetical protein